MFPMNFRYQLYSSRAIYYWPMTYALKEQGDTHRLSTTRERKLSAIHHTIICTGEREKTDHVLGSNTYIWVNDRL